MMIDDLLLQLRQQGICNERVLNALSMVSREYFVDEIDNDRANLNQPLSIGYQQTISQPYVVARMTELLIQEKCPNTILEVGTGSGYQAAVLAKLVSKVFSVERIKPLYEMARKRLKSLGYLNVEVAFADGNLGWEQKAPFDGIIVTAATNTIPQVLLDQLAIGGCMVLPLGELGVSQRLCVIYKKSPDDFIKKWYESVIFVPMLKGKEG